MAHVGGFAAGFLMAFLFRGRGTPAMSACDAMIGLIKPLCAA